MVEHAIAAVFERRERGFLREVVDVSHATARIEERPAAQDLLRRELQRDVEDLVLPLVAQLPEETEVVLVNLGLDFAEQISYALGEIS